MYLPLLTDKNRFPPKVKSRLQVTSKGSDGKEHYRGTWDAIAKILMTEGVGGFYRGIRVKARGRRSCFAGFHPGYDHIPSAAFPVGASGRAAVPDQGGDRRIC